MHSRSIQQPRNIKPHFTHTVAQSIYLHLLYICPLKSASAVTCLARPINTRGTVVMKKSIIQQCRGKASLWFSILEVSTFAVQISKRYLHNCNCST